MKYQKLINLKQKRGKEFKFKRTLLKSNLCGYRNAYTLVTGTVSVVTISFATAAANKTNKKVIFKNCTPFKQYTSR